MTLLPKTLNLALQGGGSHGAFTWGVLDTLLADGRIALEGISGTSAGAINAVALASGWAVAVRSGADPRQGARELLGRLWHEVGQWNTLGTLQANVAAMMWGGLAPKFAQTNLFAQALRGWLSPAQLNPLDLNPLRDFLEAEIDFEAIRRGPLKVFVSATHVATGKAVIFTGQELSPAAVLASTCLPTLFRAVEIDGQAYWDGGFSVNPALSPLIDRCGSADLMVVQINPVEREGTPRSQAEIMDRMNEVTFNASLLSQMRAIDFINQLIAEGALSGNRCKPIRLHRIDGGAAMAPFGAASKERTDPALIDELFKIGQEAARHWLSEHFSALGVRSTVDVRRDYLDDTRLGWSSVAPGGPDAAAADDRPRTAPGGLRPWLARLFKRRAARAQPGPNENSGPG